MRDIEFGYLEEAGVDNWNDGGVISESFEEDCKKAGLPPDEEFGYENYTYYDLAKEYLEVCYSEVE